MDQILSDIAKKIISSKEDAIGQGLMHGNAGLALFFYLLAKNTGTKNYQEEAEKLLDNVITNIQSSSFSDIENGLSGIGWAIEFLIQSNFIEGDPDEVLEEVDNRVFKYLNEENINSFELTNGLTGFLIYLIARLKVKKSPESMAYEINRELLILVINRLYELVTPHFPGLVKEMQFDLCWKFPIMLYGLSEAFRLEIYNEKIKCIYRQWLPNFEAYIPSMHINRLYMATLFQKIATQVPDERLDKQIKILLYATDFNIILNEIDPQQTNLRFGWPGMILILSIAKRTLKPGIPNYQLIEKCRDRIWDERKGVLAIIDTPDFINKSKSLGISEGMASIGLFLLYMEDGIKNLNQYL
jgi:hypothetical protein